MKHRSNGGILLSILVFLIGVLLLVGGACEFSIPLKIENRTGTVLTIYVQGVKAGNVEPNSSAKLRHIPGTLGSYLIEAKNSRGEVIYSREFAYYELVDADWKVVIPPLPRQETPN